MCTTSVVLADSIRDFGKHVIHSNVMSTSSLDTRVTQQLGIVPSDGRGVLNIAIMRKTSEDSMGKPTSGKVTAHWSDANGMMGTIPIREIRDQDAIYYIGEFDIPRSAAITFDILISVDENRPPYRYSINKAFSTQYK